MSGNIRGFDSLMAEINRLSGPQQDEAIGKVMRSVAASHQAAARLLAPVDSGELRGSIRYTVQKSPTGVTAFVHTNSDHAAFVEFGTGPVGAASGGDGSGVKVNYAQGPWAHKSKTGKIYYTDYWVYKGSDGKFHATRGMKPQPYLYPAAQAVKRKVPQLMARAFRRYIKKLGDGS